MFKYLRDNLFNNSKNQLILIVALTSLVYLNSLSNRILWDDHLFLENWPAITSWENAGEILKGSAPPAQDKIYRPLRGIFWLIDYQIFEANPVFYHLQALFIHLGSTILVFLIAQIIFKQIKLRYNILAFLTALFFGIHPIHTETIDYISASLETFGSMFFFISFYLYLKFSELPQKLKYYLKELTLIASILFAVLAFFTYEMTLTLPFLVLIYELIIVKTRLSLKSWGSRIYSLGGISFVALVYLLLRFVVFKIGARTDYLAYSFYKTMLTMAQVFVKYILLLFFPINQTAIHNLVGEFPSSMIPYDKLDPILNQTILDTPVLLSILTIGLLITVAFKYHSKYPILSFGISWFFISLLPVSYIIPGGGAMAEKYLYIPSLGFLIGVVYLGYLLFEHLNPKVSNLRSIFFWGIILIAGIFSFQTISRNTVWKDDISLFSDVVKTAPNNLLANYTLGVWFTKYNYFDQAQAYYQAAIDKSPEFWEARFNLGNIFLKESRFDEAQSQYSTIAQMYPENRLAANILANISLLKEATPSTSENGDLMIHYTRKPNFDFAFPFLWSINAGPEKITLADPNKSVTVEIQEEVAQGTMDNYLKAQVEASDSGKLINQGPAKIPNVREAYVKVFNLENQERLQFFLFEGQRLIKIAVFPASDPSLMAQFDQILGSVKIK